MWLGRLDEADRDITEALAMASMTGEGHFVAELHRRRGTLAIARSRPEEAEAAFGDALAVAREHGHRVYELRAASCLARLWAEEGEHQRVHCLLAPICGWFTEGVDMPDLLEAKKLIDQLF